MKPLIVTAGKLFAMGDLAEDRIYSGGANETLLFLACDQGLVQVRVSGDRVGEFGLETRADARDVAVDDDRVLLGTAEACLVGPDASKLHDTGLGPTQAVGLTADGWVVGGTDGDVHSGSGTGTEYLGQLDDIQAIDPPLIATSDGVFLLEDLSQAGLEHVWDVASEPVPRAAAGNGLYRLGNGWIEEKAGTATSVASRGTGECAAVIDGALHCLDEEGWSRSPVSLAEPIADILLGPAIYVITTDGTLLVDAGSGWRSRALGISDVRGMALRRRSA